MASGSEQVLNVGDTKIRYKQSVESTEWTDVVTGPPNSLERGPERVSTVVKDSIAERTQ